MKKTLYIFLLFNAFFLKAQQFRPHYYANYTVREGLAHNSIYQPFEDSRGNIWFPSDAGVSCFDGRRFRTFNISAQMHSNEIFRLFEDSHARLWCMGFSGVCYIDLNTFQVVNKPYFPKEHVAPMFEKDAETLWLCGEPYIEMRQDSCLKKKLPIHEIFRDGSGAIYGIQHTNEGLIRLYRYNSKQSDFEQISDCPQSKMNTTMLHLQWDRDRFYFFSPEKKSIMFLQPNQPCESTVLYSGEELNEETQTFKVIGEELILGTNQGAKAISLRTKKKLWKIGLGYPVKDIMQDRESNYWFVTNGGGVFYFTDPNIGICDEKSELLGDKNIVKIFGLSNGHLGFVNAANKLGVLGSPKTQLHFDSERGGDIRHVINRGDALIVSKEHETYFLPNFSAQFLGKKRDASKIKILNHLSDTQFGFSRSDKSPWKIAVHQKRTILSRDGKRMYWPGVNAFFCEIKEWNDTINTLNIKNRPARIYAACEDADGLLWWGGTGGILGYIDVQNTEIQDTFVFAGIQETVSDLIALPGNFFMGCSNGGGIFVFKNKKLVGKWAKELYSASCTRIFQQNVQNFWIASNLGVSHFYFADTSTYQDPLIRNYGNNSFPSLQINDVYVSSDSVVYLATPGGIVRFHYPSMNDTEHPPTLRIVAFSKDGNVIANKSRLWSINREISIKLLGVAFERAEKLEFEYTIYRKIPLGGTTVYTQNHGEIPDGQLNFSFYPFGVYKIVARCRRLSPEQSEWSEPADFYFFVHPPYLELALYLFAVAAMLIALLYWQKTRENHRSQLLKNELQSKSELAKAKLEGRSLAFLAQMNMHFIYNGLNTLSRYFGKDQLREGSRYLSDFSKLLRTTLNNSKKELVSLKEELNFLDTYMQVQINKHASHHIHFESIVDSALLEQDFLIPVMLVQPFLENAVNYGLALDKPESTIRLQVKDNKATILITIEDSGIGFKAHRKLSKGKRSHELHATEIVSNRMARYNQVYKAKNRFELVDKSDADPNSNGTIAEIFIRKIV